MTQECEPNPPAITQARSRGNTPTLRERRSLSFLVIRKHVLGKFKINIWLGGKS